MQQREKRPPYGGMRMANWTPPHREPVEPIALEKATIRPVMRTHIDSVFVGPGRLARRLAISLPRVKGFFEEKSDVN